MLEELMDSEHVYFRPPSSNVIETPAIIYNTKKRDQKYANNKTYISKKAYELIFIDWNPDNELVETIANLSYCTHERSYASDNNYHEVFTLYY